MKIRRFPTHAHTEICHSNYASLRYDRFPSIIYSTQTYIILPLPFAPNHYPNINESPEARCSVSSRKKCCVDWWYAQITSQKNAHICLPIWRFPKMVVPLNHPLYSRGLKSEQFSWMWTNRLRKSRHDRVTAGSQQSIKTLGDCLHVKDTKYHYNKHERAHPSHCSLLFCQHCFALQTIILPQWFDLRRSKTEWTKETMKREEVTVCEKEREEDKKRNKQRTQMKTCWKYNRTTPRTTPERPPERPLIHELSSAGHRAIIDHNMKCGTPCATAPLLHPKPWNKEKERPSHPKEVCRGMTKGTCPPCKLNVKYAGTTSANNT